MPLQTIQDILITRDGITPEEAEELVAEAKEDLIQRLYAGEDCLDICEEWFGLELDYIEQLF